MGDLRPPLLETEALRPVVALSTGLRGRCHPAVGQESPPVDHDTFIHVHRARSVAGLTSDTFLPPETGCEPGIGIMTTGDMTSQAPLLLDRIGDILIFLPQGGEIPGPVGCQPPVGRGMLTAEPGEVLVAVFLARMAGTACG